MRMQHRKQRSGFTLVEIIMATLVMVGLFTGVYRVFQAISRTQAVGQWMLYSTTELRNGLNLLRDEISQASKPRKVTQMGAVDLSGGSWDSWKELRVPAGAAAAGGKTYTTFSTNATLLYVYSTKPGREGIPGIADIPTEVTEVTLKIQDGKIVRERRVVSPMGTAVQKKIICSEPSRLVIRLIRIPAGSTLSVKNRNSVEIDITATFKKYKTTQVTETINAPFEVDAREG